jgi:hypothetical protein
MLLSQIYSLQRIPVLPLIFLTVFPMSILAVLPLAAYLSLHPGRNNRSLRRFGISIAILVESLLLAQIRDLI